eukprot:g7996.t1
MRSGQRAGYKQYHQIREAVQNGERGLWCKTFTNKNDARWTQISVDGKTAFWGKGHWRVELDEIAQKPERLVWRSAQNLQWIWSWEG